MRKINVFLHFFFSKASRNGKWNGKTIDQKFQHEQITTHMRRLMIHIFTVFFPLGCFLLHYFMLKPKLCDFELLIEKHAITLKITRIEEKQTKSVRTLYALGIRLHAQKPIPSIFNTKIARHKQIGPADVASNFLKRLDERRTQSKKERPKMTNKVEEHISVRDIL